MKSLRGKNQNESTGAPLRGQRKKQRERCSLLHPSSLSQQHSAPESFTRSLLSSLLAWDSTGGETRSELSGEKGIKILLNKMRFISVYISVCLCACLHVYDTCALLQIGFAHIPQKQRFIIKFYNFLIKKIHNQHSFTFKMPTHLDIGEY